ncbi:MAG: CRTAC1 family protein [Thermoanaerobaculia bacterium]
MTGRCAKLQALFLCLLGLAPRLAAAQAGEQVLPVPAIDWGWEMLPVLAHAQRQTLPRFQVDHDFRFTDRRPESGITFEHHVTPDSAKYYQPNHYDHGTGLLAADVDGDRRIDLYFLNQLGGNQLWQNLGGSRFREMTAEAGVALPDRVSVAGSFGDVDNDGDADLFVTTVRSGNVLFVNDGHGRFTDGTAAAGLGYAGHSSGAVFFDYDRDGLLDLFLVNVGVYTTDRQLAPGYWAGIAQDDPSGAAFHGHHNPERTEASILYRNEGGGRFRDVSAATGLVDGSWSGDAAAGDVNGDGWPDLYVLNMQGDNHYWENLEGRRFVDRTAEVFPATPWGAMGIKFFDHDNDGAQDLLITDMHSDMSREVTPGLEKLKSVITLSDEELQGGANNVFGNAFYERQPDGAYRERSDELGLENYWPWGVSVGDLNADGWQDVFISASMNFPYRYGVNSLLLNNRGQGFLDSEFLLGVEPRQRLESRPWYDPRQPWLATKRPWFTLDCSGADRSHRLCPGRSGRFVAFGNLGTRSSVIVDLDDDGDLDLVTNELNDVPQVLVSDLAERRPIHWLKLRLVGSASNRDALGAEVRLEAGDLVQTQVHDGSSGYLSHSVLPLYFGLGDLTTVDRIVVRWPTGRTQELGPGIAVDRLLEIVEQ